jgi:hypothetical protein
VRRLQRHSLLPFPSELKGGLLCAAALHSHCPSVDPDSQTMTDLEFLELLRRELSESPAWADIRGVVAPADDPALAGNELLVFPAVTERTEDRVSIFRVLVEWEVGRDRHFPATERRSDRDRIESIVALAAELHDLMLTDPRGADADWPERYRYHAFGGFPGWWCYLALCGEAFSHLPVAPDDWIAAVDACASAIWEETCRRCGPLGSQELERLLTHAVNGLQSRSDSTSHP